MRGNCQQRLLLLLFVMESRYASQTRLLAKDTTANAEQPAPVGTSGRPPSNRERVYSPTDDRASSVHVSDKKVFGIALDEPKLEPRSVEQRSHNSVSRNTKPQHLEFIHATPTIGESSSQQQVGEPEANRCSDIDMSLLEKGFVCGSPLSSPCFDYGRCQLPPQGPTMYIYDNNCTLADSDKLDMSFEKYESVSHPPRDSHWRKVRTRAHLSFIYTYIYIYHCATERV